jgi:hypothetical protein
LRLPDETGDEPALDAWEDAIRGRDLGLLPGGSYLSPFVDFVCALAEASERVSGRLLILLDRAEEIPYPCLTPVLSLLDQIHPFFTIIAARPGILGPDQLLTSDTPTPGDHYDIRHLGASPYSDEWRAFQVDVLKAWIPAAFSDLPLDALTLLLRLSRDSSRHALELVYNAVNAEGVYVEEFTLKRIELLRDTLLSAAQGKLRRLNPDLKELIRTVRRRFDPVVLPVLLVLGLDSQRSLAMPRPIREMTREEKFVRLALRTGFFSVKDGATWHPYAPLDAVELSPLFLWQQGDEWSDTLFTS